MRLAAIAFFSTALCLTTPALADSDGWFCTGPGYLAYELQTSMGVRRHELHVVRVGSGRIDAPVIVPLDPFQVHAMACAGSEIAIGAFDSTHLVAIAQTPPSVAQVDAPLDASATAHNLGHWSEAGVVEIASDDAEFRYQVVITKAENRRSDANGGVIERFTQTEIWQRARDAGGQVIATRAVFHGIFEETID